MNPMLGVIEFSESALAVIGVLLSALAAAVGVVFKLLMAAKDSQVADMKEQRDGFKKGYERSVELLEVEAQKQELARGGVPIPKLAPVKPEHNSPTSERQQFAAELATLKAREVAASLQLDGGPDSNFVAQYDHVLKNVVDGVMGRLSADDADTITRAAVEVAVHDELYRRLVASQPTITMSDIPDRASPPDEELTPDTRPTSLPHPTRPMPPRPMYREGEGEPS